MVGQKMVRFTQVAVLIMVSGFLLSCATKRTPSGFGLSTSSVIKDIRVTGGKEKTIVEIEGEEPMIYTAFRLSDPDRLVIDLDGVRLAQFSDEIKMGKGPIRSIRPVDTTGENIARLEFELVGSVETDVRMEGVNLIVEVSQLSANEDGFRFFKDDEKLPEQTAPFDESVSNEPLIPGMVTPKTEVDLEAGLGEMLEAEPAQTEVEVVEGEEDVSEALPLVEDHAVSEEEPFEAASPVLAKKPEVLLPAKTIRSVRFDQGEVLKLLVTSDGLLFPRVFFIGVGEKKRLVIDLPDVTLGSKQRRVLLDDPHVKQLRVGRHKKKIRLVLDLRSPITYSMDQSQGVLEVKITDPSEKVLPSEQKMPEAITPTLSDAASDLPELPPVALDILPPPVTEVDLFPDEKAPEDEEKTTQKMSEAITASLPELPPVAPDILPPSVTEVDLFPDEKAPEDEEKTTQKMPEAIPPPLSDAASSLPELPPAAPDILPPPVTEVDLFPDEKAPEDEEKTAKKKVLLLRKRREAARLRRERVALAKAEAEEAPLIEVQKYSGRKISLDFQDAEISNVIRLIADVSGLNFIMGDDVQGSITLKMNDVPWDQALEIILEIRSLGQVRSGDIVRIATLSNLTKQRNEKTEARDTQIRAEELVTRVIYVNYGEAANMRPMLLKLMSPRGEIMVATRVNALVVKDIEASVAEVERLANKLDTKTPQVLIEARIVEIKPVFKRSLGVRWGLDVKNTFQGTRLGIGTGFSTGTDAFNPAPDFSVNLPAANPLGAIGFSFGRFTENPFQLDLRLSAGESQEMTRIVSTPKIMVLDNHEALIKQGESIPFSSSSANGGTNVQLIDASLKLKVTPHISPDGGILLKINLTKNEPGPPVQGADNPSIFEKEVTTHILLMDSETMVIGGIYETKKSESKSGIPYLKDIPIFGWLFKNEEVKEETTELLIFITPTIMN